MSKYDLLQKEIEELHRTIDGLLMVNRGAMQEFMELFAAQEDVIAALRWQLDLANGDRFEARCLAEGKGE